MKKKKMKLGRFGFLYKVVVINLLCWKLSSTLFLNLYLVSQDKMANGLVNSLKPLGYLPNRNIFKNALFQLSRKFIQTVSNSTIFKGFLEIPPI